MERSAELEQLVAAWFAAASDGDASLVDAHVSLGAGTRLIGSDPGEVFKGGSAVAEFLRSEVEGSGEATFAPTTLRPSARDPFVQTHASIGLANEDIGWVYPG